MPEIACDVNRLKCRSEYRFLKKPSSMQFAQVGTQSYRIHFENSKCQTYLSKSSIDLLILILQNSSASCNLKVLLKFAFQLFLFAFGFYIRLVSQYSKEIYKIAHGYDEQPSCISYTHCTFKVCATI